MGEGLSAAEVGEETAEHRERVAEHTDADQRHARHDRRVSIVEATLLAIVALLAAWSGFASAQWSTESRLLLAQASTARTEASQASLEANTTKNFDGSTFDAWFSAYVVGNDAAQAIAERRFRPEFKEAFDAWTATDPANNPNAPPGPTYMAEYRQPDLDKAAELNAAADEKYVAGAEAGGYADDYVRITVFLATVLFMVGISGHFRVPSARIGLVVVGSAVLLYSVVLLIGAPRPPV